jgi:hypothetical protein
MATSHDLWAVRMRKSGIEFWYHHSMASYTDGSGRQCGLTPLQGRFKRETKRDSQWKTTDMSFVHLTYTTGVSL